MRAAERALRATAFLALVAACGGGGSSSGPAGLRFRDVTAPAGFAYLKDDIPGANSEALRMSGGVAAGDYDGDGLLDVYAVRGSIGPNLLFRNRGDGTFEEVGAAAGVDLAVGAGSGPSFVDYDGDGFLDLFVGGVETTPSVLFRNRGDGTFEDVTAAAGLVLTRRNTFGAAWGDYDGDGDLDLALAHWVDPPQVLGAASGEFLWRNNGDGTFTDVSIASGVNAPYATLEDRTFTPNFADLDGDGWPDLLMASDFGTSRVFRNRQDGTFADITGPVISDENGMGAAIGDYDNDGDLDWFVSSIWDSDGIAEGNWGISGNRLYRNRGDGTFDDATDAAGVRVGYWGWGSCFADLDHDGWLDLFHVNGFPPFGIQHEYIDDPTRLFLSNGDGTFTEQSVARGIDDRGQGRGVLCFDFDRDGDLDLFVANDRQAPRLFRNDLPAGAHFLTVRLRGRAPNTQGVGARVHVTAGGRTQMREVRAGNNYVSANAVEAHFGLGDAAIADEVRVVWPGGAETVLGDVAVDRILDVSE